MSYKFINPYSRLYKNAMIKNLERFGYKKKYCVVCGRLKSLTCFSMNATMPDECYLACRHCYEKYQNKKYAEWKNESN